MRDYKNQDVIAFRAAWQQAQPGGYQGLEPIAALRAGFDEQNGAIPVAPGCHVEEIELGGCKGERLTPQAGGTNGTIVYLHGGGHVFGSARSHRHMVSRLADAANMVAYVSDHRLAPEAPFPAGLQDAAAFYSAARSIAPDGRLLLAGESAGGNLASALVLHLAAEGGVMPDRLYLLSPWLDLTQSGATIASLAEDDLMISKQSLEDCAALYAGSQDRRDPLLSPLFGDLSCFPPTLIQVSNCEVLLSDSLSFAERAALAGCEYELQVWPEMVHAWPLFHFALEGGRRALEQAAEWMRRGCV